MLHALSIYIKRLRRILMNYEGFPQIPTVLANDF